MSLSRFLDFRFESLLLIYLVPAWGGSERDRTFEAAALRPDAPGLLIAQLILLVSFDRRAAGRSGFLGQGLQRSATTSRTLVLWENPDADLPRCNADCKGENDRGLITSDI